MNKSLRSWSILALTAAAVIALYSSPVRPPATPGIPAEPVLAADVKAPSETIAAAAPMDAPEKNPVAPHFPQKLATDTGGRKVPTLQSYGSGAFDCLGDSVNLHFGLHQISLTTNADRPGAVAAGSLSLSLQDVRVGGTTWHQATGTSTPVFVEHANGESSVTYSHGPALSEIYLPNEHGVEQLYVLRERPAPITGDLQVRVRMETALHAKLLVPEPSNDPKRPAPAPRVDFFNAQGQQVLSYASATAIDAEGHRQRMTYSLEGTDLVMTLDQAFLERAVFPLTIDPLIGTSYLIADETYALGFPDACYDASKDVFVVVWDRQYSSSDHDIIGMVFRGSDGAPLSPMQWIDTSFDNSQYPKIAGNGSNGFLVAWQHKLDGSSDANIRAVELSVSATNTIVVGAAQVTGDTVYQGRPDVGYSVPSQKYLVLWEHNTTADDIHARVWTPGTGFSPTLLTISSVEGAETHQNHPTVQNIGANPIGVAYRSGTAVSNKGSILVRSINLDSLLISAPATVETSSGVESDYDNEWPTLTGDANGAGYVAYCFRYSSTDRDIHSRYVKINPANITLGNSYFDVAGMSDDDELEAFAASTFGTTNRLFIGYKYNPGYDIFARVFSIPAAPETQIPTLVETLPVASAGTCEQGAVAHRPLDDALLIPHISNNNLYGQMARLRVIVPPASPSLVTPTDGSSTSNTRPVLDWNDVPGAATYELQVDNNGLPFASPEIDVTGLVSSTFTPPAVLPDGAYSWRVRSKDAVGVASSWSSVWVFRIDTTAPAAPTLLSPANTSALNVADAPLDWSDVPGGVSYDVDVDNNSDFSSPEYSQSGIAASAVTTHALTDGTYSWRARTRNGAGTPSVWSAVWTFSIDTVAPSMPSLLTPLDSALTNDNTPAFDWTDVAAPVTYDLQADNSGAGFPSPEVQERGLPASAFAPLAALADGLYSWRVRARDAAGNVSAWTTVRTLTIDVVPPATPALLLPADGLHLTQNRPTFDWSDAVGATSYQLQLDNDGNLFPSPDTDVAGIVASEFTPVAAITDGTYAWRVRAIDNAGNVSLWATPRTLTIDTVAPGAPTLLTPGNGITTSNSQPLFSWSAVAGVSTYEIQIDNSGNTFPSPEISQSSLAVANFSPVAALPDATYAWRVRARDAAGNLSPWSDVWSVIVDTLVAPFAFSMTSPLDGTTAASLTPTWQWNASANAATYTLEVADDLHFGNRIVNQTGLTATSWTQPAATPLAEGATFYWRVTAVNAKGSTVATGAPWAFTTGRRPAIPILLTPADASTNVALLPTLDWDDPAGSTPITFRIQIDNDGTAFPSPEFDVSNLTVSQYGAALLSVSTTYSWRVASSNAFGTSDWSTPRTFTTTATGLPPSVPALLTPADGAVAISPASTLLDWEDSIGTGPIQYHLQVTTDATFETLVLNLDSLSLSEHTTSSLAGGVPYLWRVRASSSYGTSAWSPVWTFRTSTSGTLSAAPILNLPIHGALDVPAPVLLDWSDSTGTPSGTYRLQVAIASNFRNPVLDVSGLTLSNYAPPVLAGGATYYWRVSVANTAGISAWSSIFSFRSASSGNLPTTPTLEAPTDGAGSVPITPTTLDWSDATGTSPFLYHLQISETSDFRLRVTEVTGLTVSTWSQSSLAGGTRYYWRVRASNSAGSSSWSPAQSFTTLLGGAAATSPVPLSPANGATGISTAPTFDWFDSTGSLPIHYQIQVSTDATFASEVQQRNGLTLSQDDWTATPLAGGITYYWRVRASNSAGWSSWSVISSFTTFGAGMLPTTPAMLFPGDGAAGIGSRFTFDWSDAAGTAPIQYRLQVASDSSFVSLRLDEWNLALSEYAIDPGQLFVGGTYYWRVVASNEAGTGTWSAVQSFTTAGTAGFLASSSSGNSGKRCGLIGLESVLLLGLLAAARRRRSRRG